MNVNSGWIFSHHSHRDSLPVFEHVYFYKNSVAMRGSMVHLMRDRKGHGRAMTALVENKFDSTAADSCSFDLAATFVYKINMPC